MRMIQVATKILINIGLDLKQWHFHYLKPDGLSVVWITSISSSSSKTSVAFWMPFVIHNSKYQYDLSIKWWRKNNGKSMKSNKYINVYVRLWPQQMQNLHLSLSKCHACQHMCRSTAIIQIKVTLLGTCAALMSKQHAQGTKHLYSDMYMCILKRIKEELISPLFNRVDVSCPHIYKIM